MDFVDLRCLSSGGLRHSQCRGAESVLLRANKREVDLLEEELFSQLARVTASHDRIRDGAIQRLEDKIIMAHDIQQLCLDRRVTELTGNCWSLIE